MVISSLIMFYHHVAPAKILAEAEAKVRKTRLFSTAGQASRRCRNLTTRVCGVARRHEAARGVTKVLRKEAEGSQNDHKKITSRFDDSLLKGSRGSRLLFL